MSLENNHKITPIENRPLGIPSRNSPLTVYLQNNVLRVQYSYEDLFFQPGQLA